MVGSVGRRFVNISTLWEAGMRFAKLFFTFFILLLISSCNHDYELYDARCGSPCYSGDPETRGVGACLDGIGVCEEGSFVRCEEEVLPSHEYCDAIDNDCNGTIDDFVLDEDAGKPCGSNIGECSAGSMECISGEVVCHGDIGPADEICDSLDNDCNGMIDDMESLGYCYDGDDEDLYFGECHAGVLVCDMGSEVCVNQQLPEEEVCDGLDNDCDGFTDEDLDEGDKVDIVFMIDLSGSMGSYFSSVANASQLFANAFSGNPDFRFSIVGVPYPSGRDAGVILDFSDAATFQAELSILSTLGSGHEPSWDATYESCGDILPLNWSEDARRYVVLFTDETGQSFDGLTELDAASMCYDSDTTFYGFVKYSFWNSFDDIAGMTGGNLYDLGSSSQMEEDLSEIFSDECWE